MDEIKNQIKFFTFKRFPFESIPIPNYYIPTWMRL